MAANRCSNCALNWPTGKGYDPCPQCGGRVDYVTSAKAIKSDEAKHLKAHCEFERFYAERESGRTGPSPEEVGAREAREILYLERSWRR